MYLYPQNGNIKIPVEDEGYGFVTGIW